MPPVMLVMAVTALMDHVVSPCPRDGHRDRGAGQPT